MAELFKLRLESERIIIPRRLANRLQIKEGEEFDVTIGDDRTLHIEPSVNKGVLSDASEAEMAEYREREKRLVSSERLADSIREIEKSVKDQESSPRAATANNT